MKKFLLKIFVCSLSVILILCNVLLLSGCGNAPAGTWIVSSSAPTAETSGNVGDMYLDTSSYDVYQKTAEGWMICGNIRPRDGKDGKNGTQGKFGVNGKNGTTWLTGEKDPKTSGVQGKIGDVYLNTRTLKAYKYTKNGVWEYFMTLGSVSDPSQNMTWRDDGELNILMVGNSFSDDTSYYLWKIAHSAGVENVTIGNLHIGGCELSAHLTYAQNDAAVYDYRVTDDSKNGVYTTTNNYKFSDAVKSKNWDYISFQQVSGKSGLADTFSPLTELIGLYSDLCPDAQIVWNMTWAYENDSTHASFANYGNDQTTMYNAIVNAVKTTILPNPEVDMISPTGTAIQNARAVLGDELTRDGFHLAYEESMGTGKYNARYIAALCFFGKLSGIDLDLVTYAPSNVDAATQAVAIASAQAAVDEMFATTEPHDEEPKYKLLTIEWNECKQYVSTHPVNYLTPQSAAHCFATQKFTKATLPVGSVIELASGWIYRPEGWKNDAKNTADSRPAEVSTAKITIDESWWGEWTTRAFNIRKADNSALTGLSEEVSAAFKIYVPA